MRFGPEGAPFVPPTCPADQAGRPIPDLEQVAFELHVHPSPTHLRITEVLGVFGSTWNEDGERVDWVGTPFVLLSMDSPLAQKVHRVAGLEDIPSDTTSPAIPHTESEPVDRIRRQLCERVANCQGVVNGECWALGKSAVREVIEGVLNAKT